MSAAKFQILKGKNKNQTSCVSIFSSKELRFFWKDSHIFKDMQVQVHVFVQGKGVITQNNMFTTPGSCALSHSSPLLLFQNTGELASQEQKESSFIFCFTYEEGGCMKYMVQLNLHSKTAHMGQLHGLTTQQDNPHGAITWPGYTARQHTWGSYMA